MVLTHIPGCWDLTTGRYLAQNCSMDLFTITNLSGVLSKLTQTTPSKLPSVRLLHLSVITVFTSAHTHHTMCEITV